MAIIRPRHIVPALLVMVAMLWSAGAALAGVSWTISRRDDAGIKKVLAQLDKRFRDRPHLKNEPAVIILKSDVREVELYSLFIVRNELIRVQDPDFHQASTREFTLGSDVDIKFKSAWIERGGKITRLDDEVWNIIKGQEDKPTEVILAFPDVRQGDVLGWSTEENHKISWSGGYIPMADDLPVMMCRTRLKTSGRIAYKTIGEHLRKDQWGSKILKEKHGAPCDLRFTVVDIPARPKGRFAPNWLEFEPYLLVMVRGLWNEEVNRWIYNVSWNEEAVRGSAWLDQLDEEAPSLLKDAREITPDCRSPREKADRLHCFIRDELVTVNPLDARSGKRDLKRIFDSRQATPKEKGVLMFAMCRALGLDVGLLAGRNQFLGSLDKDNPNLAQLTDFVVRLNGPPMAYFAPAYNESPPGRLPPSLCGARAMVLPRGIKDRLGEVGLQAYKNVGDQGALWWDEYCRLIKSKSWAKWTTLPGDPNEVMAWTEEIVRWFPDSGEISVQIQTTGFSDLQTELQKQEEAGLQLASYLERRLSDAEVMDATCKAAPTRDGTSFLAGKAAVVPLPGPAGDNWIIPAESVFGKVFLHEWDEGSPFILRFTEDHRFVFRCPLPAGWQDVHAPPEFHSEDAQFAYHCRFAVLDGDLVVERRVQRRRGMTMGTALPDFAEIVLRVRDFERSPLVLARKSP